MSDIADRAADREAELRADALAEHARRVAAATRSSGGAALAVCAVCGERIPAARIAASPDSGTCIECQMELEIALMRGGLR